MPNGPAITPPATSGRGPHDAEDDLLGLLAVTGSGR